MKKLQALRSCSRAATAIEYGLILALIFLAMITAASNVATSTSNMWNNISTGSNAVL